MAFSALSFYFVIIVPLQGYDEPKVSLIQTPSLVRLLLTVHNLAGDLTTRLNEFINYYNTQRYHESLNNLTPEGVSIGRGQTALNRRMRIK
jgi:transposase InsO family protein